MNFLSAIKNKNFAGKTCLLRVDFNVDFSTSSRQEEVLRLWAVLPTANFLLRKKAQVIILSHRGRPNKIANRESRIAKFSLKPFVPFLERKLKQRTVFLHDLPKDIPEGKLFLMENLRFYEGEEANDLEFAKKLARLGDFYVNDAFGVSHRENASVTQLPKLLPSYAGLLMEKEIKTLTAAMKSPKKPLVLIFGGAKVKDKLPVIKKLLPKANKALLGSSILNHSYLTLLKRDKKIIKPLDWLNDEQGRALDIGPLTVELYADFIKKAKTIIWNGPVGYFEDKRFAAGSIAIAKAVSKSGAFSIVGGGETTTLFMRAISNYRFLISKHKLFLSTGGGSMLEFLSGKKLPGIVALK